MMNQPGTTDAPAEDYSNMSSTKFFARLLATAALGAIPTICLADDATHVGFAVTGGLSGLGADVGVNITDFVGVRATAAGFSISKNGNYGTDVTWNGNLKLFQAGALLDVFPFAGAFHLTAGVVQDGNKFTLTGQPSSGNFTFNGNTYPSSDVASAAATVEWNKAVPYVGLGFGNLGGSRGLHFTSDLGALITGSPNATVNVVCSAAGQVAGVCAALANDVAAEQTKLQNDVHKLTFWPVLRFGVGFSF